MRAATRFLARYTAHGGVGKQAGNLLHGAWINHGVGIGKGHIAGLEFLQTVLKGGRLAAALGAEHDINLGVGLKQLVGAVGAAIGYPHNTELFAGVIDSQGVGHLLGHHIFFVISTNKQGDGGQLLIGRHDGLAGSARKKPF